MFVYYMCYCVQVMCEMGDNEVQMPRNEVQQYTLGPEHPPRVDSGVGVTAESTSCTFNREEQHDDMKVIGNETRLCPTAHFDPIRKTFVIRCHQESCIHTEHRKEAIGESTTGEGSEKLPIECSDKCHQGELVVSPRF